MGEPFRLSVRVARHANPTSLRWIFDRLLPVLDDPPDDVAIELVQGLDRRTMPDRRGDPPGLAAVEGLDRRREDRRQGHRVWRHPPSESG